ncbi:hypothetical protein QQF64_030681 [Cirrhinus molitorella]|uniref:Transmembrane protein n=1 Tax=Cirrhinus molitorella TaxID=172907 RepID=A0ABR3N406_9TELE
MEGMGKRKQTRHLSVALIVCRVQFLTGRYTPLHSRWETQRERKEEKQEMKTGGKIYIRTPLLGFSIIATATGYLATGYTMVR